LPVGGAAPRTFAPGGKNPRAALAYIYYFGNSKKTAVADTVYSLHVTAISNEKNNS